MARKVTTEEFIERARAVHGDQYDNSKVEYVSAKTKVPIVCREHGVFMQSPDKHGRAPAARSQVKTHQRPVRIFEF